MKRAPLFLLVLGVLSLVPAAARAEVMVGQSIEWVVAASDWVGAGHIVKVEPAGKYEAVTLRVTRTFKGNAAGQVTFLMRNFNGPVAKDWQATGQPLLVCLESSERFRKEQPDLPADVSWMLRHIHNHHCAVGLGKAKPGWPGTIEIYTRDFKNPTEPTAILKRVEKAAARFPAGQVPRPHSVHVPSGTEAFQKLWGGSAVYLIVPVDEELEVQARRWCMSKDYGDRLSGVRVLRHFKNEHNIQVLKSLLDDPGYSIQSTIVSPRKGPGIAKQMEHKKVYEVRLTAYDALSEFGVRVEVPVLFEPVKNGS